VFTEKERQAVAVEAARVTALAKERMGTPTPTAYLDVHKRVWPQQVPVRDLLGIVDAWGELAKGTLYALGAEALGQPGVPPVKMHGALLALSRMKGDMFDAVRRASNDAVLMRYWGKSKIAYTVHPGLAEALADTTGTDAVPASVMRQLPHPDPLFLFPQALPVTLSDGMPGLIRGFFVTGLITLPGGNVRTSSADPEATGLQLAAFSQVGTADIPPMDWDLSSVSVPLSGEFTVVEAAAASADGWDVDPASATRTTHQSTSAWTDTILRLCLPVLLYACSSEPDEQAEVRPPVKKRSGTQRAAKPARVRQLGYRIGPGLQATRKVRPERTGNATGRTVAAHMRRAHWHTFRFGTGRAESYVKWLPPIPVNPHGGDADQPTVITIN
jgi:hypothetical protein